MRWPLGVQAIYGLQSVHRSALSWCQEGSSSLEPLEGQPWGRVGHGSPWFLSSAGILTSPVALESHFIHSLTKFPKALKTDSQLTAKAKAAKAKVSKWDYILLKSFYTARETIHKKKKQSIAWKKIFANHPPDKGLIPKI